MPFEREFGELQSRIESELRSVLTNMAETNQSGNREQKLEYEEKVENLRTQLEAVMGKEEADRKVLDLREEILGEKYD